MFGPTDLNFRLFFSIHTVAEFNYFFKFYFYLTGLTVLSYIKKLQEGKDFPEKIIYIFISY